MGKVVILGSSNAIPDEKHENTHMAVIGGEHVLLIDCVSNPVVRLPQAGIEVNNVTDLILTHFHPDHVSGAPLLLMDMWLLGRKKPLNVYGLEYTLERFKDLMSAYDWETWPNFYPVNFHTIPEEELTLVIENSEFKVIASPVCHLIPTVGLRVEFTRTQRSMAYSCDTEPCPQVVRLAEGADVLIHEAAGASKGHTSAAQAGDIARQAEVGTLYLIHYRTRGYDPAPLLEDARESFGGKVKLAEDFMTIEF